MAFSLTVGAVQALRAKQEPIPSGVAPCTNSNSFKSPNAFFKPVAKTWDHRLSLESKARKESTLKGYATSLQRGAVISLGTARPTAETFPWEFINFHGASIPSSGQPQKATAQGAAMNVQKYGGAFELGVALNYGHSAGAPQLVRFFTEHVEIIHNPPYSDWECCATCGNTSALELAFRTFCNPGDVVLCEEFTYSGAVEAVTPLGASIESVKMDERGLIPEELDRILSKWDWRRGPKPFVLYTIPTGHNPTGVTQPADRRRLIYEVAEKHDLYIIEDDPYYFLQLASQSEQTNGSTAGGDKDFLSLLPPSYLSLDRSGRVLRLDSASKIIAPGLRCGWMTGASQIIQKLLCHHEVSVVAPSGVSQIMLYKLLDETWGHEGFITWLASLSARYRAKRDILMEACQMYVPRSICNWESPKAGMFLWVDINWRKHPAAHGFDDNNTEANALMLEIEDRIFTRAVNNGVMINKGSWFRAKKESPQSEVSFRLTFAATPLETLEEAAKRFGDAVATEFNLVKNLGLP